MNEYDEMADLLLQWFPDHTPAERFHEWQLMNLELIKAGSLAALLQANGDIRYKHVENCTDAELERSMTAAQYRLWMQK